MPLSVSSTRARIKRIRRVYPNPESPKDAWEGVHKGYEVQIQDGAGDEPSANSTTHSVEAVGDEGGSSMNAGATESDSTSFAATCFFNAL